MSVAAPQSDADIPAFVAALGLPGLIDIHTHFMPAPVMNAVWRWFDEARMPDGTGWPIAYRLDDEQRVELLQTFGVRAFTALNYAHKPGMAQWLNDWTRDFAASHEACVPTATFYPEPEADGYVAQALEAGVRVFKVHLQVGAYDPRAPELRSVWRRLAAAGVAVVTHAGSGPVPGPHTGPGPMGEVLEANPELVAVIAHMGGGEYEEFLQLALRYPNVHLDCTITFTDFMNRIRHYPAQLLDTLAERPDKVVFGTDFPNIPHAYAHQLEALVRLDFGDDWLRAVCHDNGARLLSVGSSTLP